MIDELVIDLRHSIRRFRRSPVSSAVVVATLALAIGANVTVFSLLNGTSLRRVDAAEPDGLVAIAATDVQTNRPGPVYAAAFDAFREAQRSFATLSMYSTSLVRAEVRGTVMDVGGEGVTSAYLEMTGAKMLAGRWLTDGDNAAARTTPPVAVISERLWHRLFASDARMLGEIVTLDGRPVAIVGVAAAPFRGLSIDTGVDLWLPISVARSLAGDGGPVRATNLVGRLAPGVTLQQARAEVLARWPGVQAAAVAMLPPAAQSSVTSLRVAVESLSNGFSSMRTQYASAIVMLLGLTVILLSIGCVNLMGLMRTRVLAGGQEIAVKLALGVGRARLFRQLLFEGILLAVLGLAGAIPLAWWSSQALTRAMSLGRSLPLDRSMTPDGRVLAVATAVALAMGLAIAFFPSWRAVNGPRHDLRNSRGGVRTLGRPGRAGLVVQVALSMVLLLGASLFAGMFSILDKNQSQLRQHDVLFSRLSRKPGDRAVLGREYFRQLVDELSSIPGVEGAVLSNYFPGFLGFRGTLPTDRFAIDGIAETAAVTGLTELVTPGFFRTFGIAQRSGRDFAWTDDEQSTAVTIISESLAARLFPGGGAIGRRLNVMSGTTTTALEVIGVVADAPIGSVRDPHLAVAFRPMTQNLARAQLPMAHVRVNGDLAAVRDAYVRKVEGQGHHFIRGLLTLDEWMDNALLQERLLAAASTSAAVIAMLLACLGMYAAFAYAVASRVREIGIRLAVGASPRRVLLQVVRDGLLVAVAGVALGIPAAVGAASLIRSQLFGVTATDPRILVACAAAFLVTGVCAAIVPAWKASKTDPTTALRQA